MLTEFALRNLKPRTALYKIADRDGMYVAVSQAGTISFRYDYRINGRRETLTIGRYGPTFAERLREAPVVAVQPTKHAVGPAGFVSITHCLLGVLRCVIIQPRTPELEVTDEPGQ